MEKIKCFITVNSMEFGGIQKSLIAFLNYLEGKAEVDLLIWDDVREIEVPKWVNILDITTVKSVTSVIKSKKIFSKDFLVSMLAATKEHRWLAMSKPKKEYDVAIAYSQVGAGKYYVIDRVNAKRKFAFYHNGAYVFNDTVRELDKQYYPKYDALFAVSEHIKDMLHNELTKDIEIDVLHNLVDVKTINQQGKEPCEEMDSFDGLKIVTVGRLSQEKNPIAIPKVCDELKKSNKPFKWYIIGDGVCREELEKEIKNSKLEGNCILCGMQSNPYKYMSRCDVYVQLSAYEAEPVTIQEVAIFGKPMVLTNIEGFKRYSNAFDNISLTNLEYNCVASKILTSVNNLKNNLKIIDLLQNDDRDIINSLVLGVK